MPQKKIHKINKCDRCGAVLNPDGTCAKCGTDIVQPQNLEIEFKNFKISELLDIRVRAGRTSQGKAGKQDDGKK